MAQIDLVVIGASAGGLTALIELVSTVPPSLDATILVVSHTRSDSTSYLAEILARSSPLPVRVATHAHRLDRGKIFVAPPDAHLTVVDGYMRLGHGPKENGFRPAVDPLFRAAARAHGSAVMGIVLSGALDDGTYGLQVIKEYGGTTVVQDPDEAAHPGMPLSALKHVEIDHVLRASDIGTLIAEYVSGSGAGDRTMARQQEEPEPQDPAVEMEIDDMDATFGPASGLTCPDCGGALWEIHNGELTRYRCHVGHQFTTDGLDEQQREALEAALWSSVRMLEERAELRERMAGRARDSGVTAVSAGFSQSANDLKRQAHTIRELLLGRALPAQRAAARPRARSGKTTKAKARRKAG